MSDPLPGAEQLGVYVVGDQWRTIPYRELTYKAKQKAEFLNLGTIPAPVEVYFKAIFPSGESPAKHLTIRKDTYIYDYLNSTSVLESAMWW